jgi:hypothetical protein
MSAPLQLNSEQLHALASALEELTELSERTGVDFSSYGQLSALVGISNVSIRRDEQGRYVVDDRIGA